MVILKTMAGLNIPPRAWTVAKLYRSASIDRISPSIYENYGHVVDGSFNKTRELFKEAI